MPGCYCWTYTSADPEASQRCQLKHILQNGSTSFAGCISGNVKSPLPVPPPTAPPPLPPPPGAHSVLFLVVDDLRPQLGTYSAPFPHTPHIDQLAATGLRFDRAYVQWPVCVRWPHPLSVGGQQLVTAASCLSQAPSRNSFMSGRRPDTTHVFEFLDHFREVNTPAIPTTIRFPGIFRRLCL